MKGRVRSLAVAGVFLLSIAGCSGNGPSLGERSAGTTVRDDAPTAPAKPESVLDVRDPQGSVKGYEGAKEDATLDACTSVDGALEVGGTVTNPTGTVKQYRIYVSAMHGKDTYGVTQVDVDPVAPGQSADWSTIMGLTTPDLTCVLRVERFDPLK